MHLAEKKTHRASNLQRRVKIKTKERTRGMRNEVEKLRRGRKLKWPVEKRTHI